MKDKCFLIVGINGIKDMRKTNPSLGSGEISVKINIDIPDKAFFTPQLEGTLKVPEDAFSKKIQELEFELKRIKESD